MKLAFTMFAVVVSMAAVLGAGSSRATSVEERASAPHCDNFFGQRCVVSLPTGVHMSYFDVGPPGGENVILLHTDTTSAVEWAWTVDALVRLNATLHIYALDQRGAGSTDLPETATCRETPNSCITQRDLAADLLAFMDVKKITKATLIGHAMGAEAARLIAPAASHAA